QLLFEVLDDLCTRGFPAGEITFGGFSQGSLMAIDVGLRYSQRFAGIVGLSGWVCEPETLLKELSPVARQQRLLLTHGTADPLLPIAQVRPQIPLLKAAGLNVEWVEFAKVHTIIEEELVLVRDFVRAGYGEGRREKDE
ncbi:MAG: alpha/beta hydrolase, partial [Limisphaerales bacterium]